MDLHGDIGRDVTKRNAVSEKELARFLAEPAPRKLTHAIKRASVGNAILLTRNFGAGLFFFCFSIPFIYAFFPTNILDDWQLRASGILVQNAHVVDVEATDSSVFKERVYRFTFTFKTRTGEPVTSECFALGLKWTKKQSVSVRYLPDVPKVAHIVGGRRDKFPILIGLFFLIFPIVGLSKMFIPMWKRGRKLRLLVNGKLTEFEIFSLKPGNTYANKQAIYEITLQSKDWSKVAPVTLKTYDLREVALLRGRKKHRKPVLGLVMPGNPKGIVFPEAWAIPEDQAWMQIDDSADKDGNIS